MRRAGTRRTLPRRPVVCTFFAAVLCASVSGGLLAQEDTIRIGGGEHFAIPGLTVTVPVEIETTQSVTGFSFAVTHAPERLTLVDVSPSADLRALLGIDPGTDPGGDFFLIDTDPSGGPGFVVAAILGAQEAEAVALPAGTHHIFDVTYEVAPDVSGSASISFTADLGTPPVALVIDAGGTSVPFEPSGAEIDFAASFRRGDTDGSGRFEVTDAVRILRFRFRGEDPGICPPALNVDGSFFGGSDRDREDRGDVELTDAVQLLQYMFAQGLPPAPPFESCGHPEVAAVSDMICRGFDGCP